MSLDYVSGTLEGTIRTMAVSPESICHRGALALAGLLLLTEADFPEGESRQAYEELKRVAQKIEVVGGEGLRVAATRQLTDTEAEEIARKFVRLADHVHAAIPVSV